MAIEPKIHTFACPSDEIAAYIDGELDSVCEFDLEQHLANCADCSLELNQQKQFLRHLDISLKHERELDLPADFAKHIVANAESTVSGLRRPRERFNALFICAGLALFVLFALGAEAGTFFQRVSTAVEQLFAIADVFAHLVYSIFLGLAVIGRTIASRFQAGVLAMLVMAIVFAVFSLFVSRKVLRTRA